MCEIFLCEACSHFSPLPRDVDLNAIDVDAETLLADPKCPDDVKKMNMSQFCEIVRLVNEHRAKLRAGISVYGHLSCYDYLSPGGYSDEQCRNPDRFSPRSVTTS
jgi:hypothetical protein